MYTKFMMCVCKRYDLWAKVRHDFSKIFGEWYFIYIYYYLVNDLFEMFDNMTCIDVYVCLW